MTSPRALHDDITNALDFLTDQGLVLYPGTISLGPGRVSWSAPSSAIFFVSYGPATASQYLSWVRDGQYSAALPDGSLLQLTYDFEDGEVAGHRLAYVPCPVLVDEDLLLAGEPIADLVEL